MKTLPERISYYTCKVAERSSHHPSKKLPARYTYRHERLTQYKKRMNELINEAGYLTSEQRELFHRVHAKCLEAWGTEAGKKRTLDHITKVVWDREKDCLKFTLKMENGGITRRMKNGIKAYLGFSLFGTGAEFVERNYAYLILEGKDG
jgi:hypothetical protein